MSPETYADPKKVAVALKYLRDQDPAPRLAAKGQGFLADQIIAIAQQHGIPIRSDSDLVAILSALEVDDMIPVEAYVAVAEMLRYIYQANGKMKQIQS